MFRKFNLHRLSKNAPMLSFEWDSETGVLRGEGAENVRTWCQHAVDSGGVTGHPLPTFHAVTDPLHDIRQMAVVIGQLCHLSGELEQAYPRIKDDLPAPDDFPPGTIFTS